MRKPQTHLWFVYLNNNVIIKWFENVNYTLTIASPNTWSSIFESGYCDWFLIIFLDINNIIGL